MTELKTFLVALYDALSEAETEAFVHGRDRLLDLVEGEQVPRDVSVPVYHATNMNVSLDVGLAVEQTEAGTEIYITDSSEDDSTLSFDAEVFDLIEEEDIETLDYDDIVSEYPGEFPGSSDVGESSGAGMEGDNMPDDNGTGEESAEDEQEGKEESTDGEREEEAGSRRVDTVEGIGRPAADILERSGIETVADLMGRTPEELREIVGEGEEEAVSPEEVNSWLRAAENAAEWVADRTLEQPVESIDGIGPTYGERLQDAGVGTLPDLARREPEEIAGVVSTDTHAVTPEQTAQWIEQAERRLRTFGERTEQHRRREDT